MEVSRRLGLSTAAPAIARDAVWVLEPIVPRHLAHTAALVVSELVTNSVRHSGMQPGDPILIRISANRDVVRVEVIDEGRGFRPSVREPRADAEGGWGLYLVDQLADRWGVRDDGRVVWAELESEIALSA